MAIRQTEWLSWKILKKDKRIADDLASQLLLWSESGSGEQYDNEKQARVWIRSLKEHVDAQLYPERPDGACQAATEEFVDRLFTYVRFFGKIDPPKKRAA